MNPGHITIIEWRIAILKENWREAQFMESKPEIGPLDQFHAGQKMVTLIEGLNQTQNVRTKSSTYIHGQFRRWLRRWKRAVQLLNLQVHGYLGSQISL